MHTLFQRTALALFTVSLFVACKKDFQPPTADASSENALAAPGQPVAKQGFVRIKTETTGSFTHTYYYDVNGRQIADLTAVADTFGKMNYPDASHVTYFLPNAKDTAYYSLNNQGLAAFTKTNNFERTAAFNAERQWTTQHYRYFNGDELQYTAAYENGNRTMVIKKIKNSAVSDTSHYTYYTDKANVLDSDAWGISYRGQNSKNLVKHAEYKTNGVLHTEDYSYQFDRLGRVVKKTTARSGYSTLETTYTYY